MRLRVLAVGAFTLMLGCGEARDVASARGVALERIGTFAEPVYVTAPPGDRWRLFVVERGGRIRVVVDGHKRARPFLDISDQVSSGEVESARVRGDGLHDVRSTGLRVNALSSFGQDARGRAYAVSLSGPVYRFVPRG